MEARNSLPEILAYLLRVNIIKFHQQNFHKENCTSSSTDFGLTVQTTYYRLNENAVLSSVSISLN